MHSKVIQLAAKKRTIQEVRELSAAGRFQFLVLTTSEAKAERLRELFASRPVREMEVEIVSVPASAEIALSRVMEGGRNA